MEKVLKKFSTQFKDEDEMCIVAVMSHGENGVIFGIDGIAVSNEDIVEMFNNAKTPKLKGKPKFFIFAQCRCI